MQIPHGFCRSSQAKPEKGPKDDPSHRPRVHHIPIHVEGRSDSPDQRSFSPFTPSSSANYIDMCDGPEVPVTRGRSFSNSSNPNLTRSSSSVSDAASQRSFSSASVDSNNNNASEPCGNGKKIRQIPITIETDASSKRSGSGSAYSYGGAHSRGTPSPGPNLASFSSSPRTQQFSPSGPHVTSIPVNINKSTASTTAAKKPASTSHGQENGCHAGSPASNPSPTPCPSGPKSPMAMIDEVNAKLADLKNQINQFTGDTSSKEFRFFDEMLTRLLISCDDIDTQGDPDIRAARKGVINSIHKSIALLESRTKANEVTVDETVATAESSSDVPMNGEDASESNTEPMSTVIENEAEEATPPTANDKSNVQSEPQEIENENEDDKQCAMLVTTEEADSTQDVPMNEIEADSSATETADDIKTSQSAEPDEIAVDESTQCEPSTGDASSVPPEATISSDKTTTDADDATPNAKLIPVCQ